VILTIDENIQFIVERELATAIEQTRARAGTVLVQDPSNGEILAMASWPKFNPNAPAGSPAEARMNRAVGALYEPGSVFKIVTLSAAIDQGITTPDEVVDCQMGAIYIAGHRIRDHKAYGLLTVSQILTHSSDVGAIKIGLRLGAPKFYQYIRAYGFGELTGIDLPGENRGLLRRVENWTPVSVGSISMGQEVGVTPLQMINAVSAIANGGLLYRPHIVLALRRGPETEQEQQPPPRRVVRQTTAAAMRAMLEGVVLNGTGTKAQLDGYTSAGKTGTAQKIDPATGRYSATQLIASFVGFAPINNPAVTILVQLDSPVGLHEGGSVAAPVFKRIAEQVLPYLNVPHDVPVSPATLRAARRSQVNEVADVSDFDPAQVTSSGFNDSVQFQPVAATQLAASPSAPTVELAEGEGISVPDLTGKTVRQVTEICVQLGVNPVLVGAGTVQEQSPQPGAMLRRGASLIFRFGRPVLTQAQLRTQGQLRKAAAR
jgi:cell division protein FtsI (penicillin-binding protein 3)